MSIIMNNWPSKKEYGRICINCKHFRTTGNVSACLLECFHGFKKDILEDDFCDNWKLKEDYINDEVRIEALEELQRESDKYDFVILRMSNTDRGWRLHHHREGSRTVREAIDEFIKIRRRGGAGWKEKSP